MEEIEIKYRESKIVELKNEILNHENEIKNLNYRLRLRDSFVTAYGNKYNFDDLQFNIELTKTIKELNDKDDFEPPCRQVYNIGQIHFCHEGSGHPGVRFSRWKKPAILPYGIIFAD